MRFNIVAPMFNVFRSWASHADARRLDMPVTYEVDEETNIVHVIASGAPTDPEMLEFQSLVMTDKRIKPGFRALFDGTALDAAMLSEGMIHKILGMEIASSPFQQKLLMSRTALVIGESWGETLATIFSQRADRNAAVFQKIEHARRWLAIDDSPTGQSTPPGSEE